MVSNINPEIITSAPVSKSLMKDNLRKARDEITALQQMRIGARPVQDWGAAGDGVTDDTAALQAAFSAQVNIIFDNTRTYKITGGLTVSQHRKMIFFDGARLLPSGDFNVITVGPYDHVGIFGLHGEAIGMTGGTFLYTQSTERVYLHRCMVYNSWNGADIHNGNGITMLECNFPNYRGFFGIRARGDNNAGPRLDILRIYSCGAVATADARTIRSARSLHINGSANSIEIFGGNFLQGANGTLIDAAGPTATPFGVVGMSFAASEYSSDVGLYIGAGEDFYFQQIYVHGSGRPSEGDRVGINNVYIAPGVKNVQIIGGKITDPTANGIATEGDGVLITGLKLVNQAMAGQGGRFDGVYIGPGARNTRIVNNEIGSRWGGFGDWGYAVVHNPGALQTVISDNTFAGFRTDPVLDLSAANSLQVQIGPNAGGYRSEMGGVRSSVWAGANALISVTLAGGVITNAPVISQGDGWLADPDSVIIVGDGVGGAIGAARNTAGGIFTTVTAGGNGYTWARAFIKPRLVQPFTRIGGTGVGGVSYTLSARSEGNVELRNDSGVLLIAAGGNGDVAVPRIAASGDGSVTFDIIGSAAGADMNLLPKGGGYLKLGGPSDTTPPTGAAIRWITIRDVNGGLFKVALYPPT